MLKLRDTAGPETAMKSLERFSRELRETAEPPPHSPGVAANSPKLPPLSFSASVFCETGDAPDRCLARADELLHQAKRRGRAVVVRETNGRGSRRYGLLQ